MRTQGEEAKGPRDEQNKGNTEANPIDRRQEVKKWTNLFRQNRVATHGMALNYVPPQIIDGQTVVQLEVQDVKKEEEKWSATLIAYIVGENPGYNVMRRYIAQHWLDIGEQDLFLHEDDYYVIKFQNMDDMHRIFHVGPHTIRNRSIILKPWTPDFDISKEFLTDILLWVIFPKLPMSCWGNEALSKIASAVGKPLFADECTTKQTRISYARMLIEVNVTKTLTTEIMVMDPRGKVFQQAIGYEWKPVYCDKYQAIRYICQNHQGNKEQRVIQPQRRREAKKVTYEWRTKGPITKDMRNEEHDNAEGNMGETTKTPEVPYKAADGKTGMQQGEVQFILHHTTGGKGSNIKEMVDRGKNTLDFSFENFPMLTPQSSRISSKRGTPSTSVANNLPHDRGGECRN